MNSGYRASKTRRGLGIWAIVAIAAIALGLGWAGGCGSPQPEAVSKVATGDTDAVIAARGLTPDDLGLGPIPSLGTAIVVDPGTPFSNIMIVLGEHVPVRSVQLPSS